MPKYLCLQRSLGAGQGGAEKPSPAEMQAMYEKFNAWREKFEGHLADLHLRSGHEKEAARYGNIALETAPTTAIREVLRRRLGRCQTERSIR